MIVFKLKYIYHIAIILLCNVRLLLISASLKKKNQDFMALYFLLMFD